MNAITPVIRRNLVSGVLLRSGYRPFDRRFMRCADQ